MPIAVAREIVLTNEERAVLEGFARRRKSARGLAQRSEIVLEAAAGRTNTEIARRLRVGRPTVARWRNRFAEQRVAYRTADHARLLAVAIKHPEQADQRVRMQPRCPRGQVRMSRHRVLPGMNLPSSTRAGS